MKIIPIQRFTVSGNSMLPTLKPGQDVLCFNWWRLVGIKVGDIVVIKVNGKEMVKRIQNVYDLEVFVEGDNKKDSTDSRSFGPVKKDQIIGKIIFKI